MRIEVITVPSQKPYPKLMIVPSSETVVLMTEKSRGTVISVGTSNHYIGHYSYGWNMDEFEDFKGTITITEA